MRWMIETYDFRTSVPPLVCTRWAARVPTARAALAGPAHAQGEVTVGGAIEVIGGTSDHDDGQDGLDRGLFSRINVGYTNTLDNGLEINGNISYIVNQRNPFSIEDDDSDEVDTERVNYAPDVLFISVGGGFGTVTMGHHAMASCATMPRVIAFVPGGVNATWYRHFAGLWGDGGNVTFSESNYCGTPTGISYSTPSMGGLSAMVSYAPNMDADQTKGLMNADGPNDYFAVAGKFSSDLGGMSVNLGASYQQASDDLLESAAIAATVGMGGATVGFSWYDNGDDVDGAAYRAGTEGWNVGAKYSLGAITPGVTYSQFETEAGGEASAIVVGATYAVGGGFNVFAEYMGLEYEDEAGMSDDETLLMSGVTLGF